MVKYHTVLVQEIFCLLAEDQSLIDTVLICMEHYPSTVLSNCTKNRPCWFELYKLYHCSWYKLWKSRGGSNLKAPKGFSEDKVETASVARPEAKNPRGHKLYHALHCTSLHCTTMYLSSGLLCEEPGAVVPGEYCGRPGGGGGTQEGDLQCAVYRYSVQTSVQCRLQGKVYRVQSTECTLQMT